MKKNDPCALLAGAMAAPLVHFSGGSWVTLLVTGTVIGALDSLLPGRQEKGKWGAVLEAATMTFLLAAFLPLSSMYWPGKWSETVVPAGILALSLWASGRKPERVGGFLLPLMVLILLPVAAAAVKTGQIKWLEPSGMEMELLLIPVLLLPGILNISDSGRWYWGILLFGILAGVAVCAVLSPGLAAAVNDPIRQMGRTLTLGAASRFEPVISVFMTFAWFCLFSLLLSRMGKGKWFAAPAAFGLSFLNPEWIGLFAVVLTLVLRLNTVISGLKNFPKKSEKSA